MIDLEPDGSLELVFAAMARYRLGSILAVLLFAAPLLASDMVGPGRCPPSPAVSLLPATAIATLSRGPDMSLDPEALDNRGLVIGEISVRNQSIFDPDNPKENRKIFLLANRLHIATRLGVIRTQLLFREGDPFSSSNLEESERIVRANRYIYDASILPTRVHDNKVDIEVVTRDVWTLSAGGGFRREGGENVFHFSLSDRNFLGLGKYLNAEYQSTVDRSTTTLSYEDPNLFGTRGQLLAELSDSSDGFRHMVDLSRPFYSLDTHWAAGLRGISDERVENLYDRGEIFEQFRHEQSFAEVSGGLSRGITNGVVRRLSFGLTYQQDLFSEAVGAEPLPLLPEDRLLIYPWVGIQSTEDRFEKLHDIDRIERTEDRYLGLEYSARLGWSSDTFGADRDRWIYDAGIRDTLWSSPVGFLQASAGLSGRWGDEGAENLLVGSSLHFYHRTFGRHLFFARIALDLADNLDRENQLLLGGDNGLRGYPLRYQNGDRRFLITLEQRFFTDWNLFQLVNVGGAVFFDMGRSFFDHGPSDDASGILRDIGFGLRLGSTRSSRGGIIHIDLAFPLDGDESIRSVQWLIRTRETF